MRIGIDIKAFKNGSTGIVRYLRSIMDELQRIDMDNEYFLFEPRPLPYEPVGDKWRKVLIPWKLPGIIWLQLVVPWYLRKHRIDVFWAGEQVCPLPAPRGTRLVTTIYDFAYAHFPESYQWSNLLILKTLAPMVFRRSDSLMTISDSIRREALELYGRHAEAGKVVSIPCGAPQWSPPADYRPSQRKNFLFFAGNLEPRKNLVRLVEALKILKAEGLTVPLHLAGPSGWKNAPLFRAIQESSIGEQVRLLGYLSEQELKNQYLTCSAVIYPSVYEGFGLPVLEAFSLDCPVLTSRGTVMEEIAKEHAGYFDPHDAADIARVIREHLTQRRRAGIRRATRHLLDRYTWHNTALGVHRILTGRGNA
jgi:glycosyltransferase involved in cell wall biosynthesis